MTSRGRVQVELPQSVPGLQAAPPGPPQGRRRLCRVTQIPATAECRALFQCQEPANLRPAIAFCWTATSPPRPADSETHARFTSSSLRHQGHRQKREGNGRDVIPGGGRVVSLRRSGSAAGGWASKRGPTLQDKRRYILLSDGMVLRQQAQASRET